MMLEGEIWEVGGTGSAEERELSDQPLEIQAGKGMPGRK